LQWLIKKPFGYAQGTPLDLAQDRPFDSAQDKPFDYAQGKFPGADKILRQLQHGSDKIRAGLVVESKIPVRDGAVIINNEDKVVGIVTSGGFSPSLCKPVAMALLDRDSVGLGNTLYTLVRDRKIAVTVSKLPFVPHRYHK
jgi:aminomethyltransferase